MFIHIMTSYSRDLSIKTERKCYHKYIKFYEYVTENPPFDRVYYEETLNTTQFIIFVYTLLFSSMQTSIRIGNIIDIKQNKHIKLHVVKVIRKKAETEKRNKQTKIIAMNCQEEYDSETQSCNFIVFSPFSLTPREYTNKIN